MKYSKALVFIATTVIFAAGSSVSHADAISSSIHVRAKVVAVCRVNSNDNVVNMGAGYHVVDNVAWSCTNGASPSLSIDGSSLGGLETGSPLIESANFQRYSSLENNDINDVVSITLEF